VSNFRSCGPLAYSTNECAKQLLYALDDSIWGMKIYVLMDSSFFRIFISFFQISNSTDRFLENWGPIYSIFVKIRRFSSGFSIHA
jgi:hypothetical protein